MRPYSLATLTKYASGVKQEVVKKYFHQLNSSGDKPPGQESDG